MAKKNNTNTNTNAAPSRFEELKNKANKAADVLGRYEGQGPKDLLREGEEAALIPFEELLDRPVIITGYSMRSGEKGPFAVICIVEEDSEEIFVTTTGGMVILEKLREASMKNLFPLSATFSKPEGKKYFVIS